jgi:hypothetical protein
MPQPTDREMFELPKPIAAQFPLVDGMMCVEVLIPADLEYLYLLQGLIAKMTDYWSWVGTDEERKSRAKLCLDAYIETDWSQCMNCEDVADCIEENEAVQDALADWFSDAVDNNSVVQDALERAFDPSRSGDAIPDGYANQNQYGAALGCDLDDGWGHIRDGLIPRSFQRVHDVLETIEFHTDNKEMLAEFLNAIPVIGAFFDVIPVTDWVLFFDNVRAWMKEAFEAGDTTDLRDEVACDLFCIWQENCSLSVKQIRDYYWSRTEAVVPSWEGAFASMTSLAAALATGSLVTFGDAVVFALVGSQYGFLTFINDWFGIHIDKTSGDLALGDPSDDHLVLCDVCPTTYCDDMAAGLGAMTFEVSSEHPFAVWDACDDDGHGTVGGAWEADEGEAGNGAIVGVHVCNSTPVFGLSLEQASVVVDLGEEKDISHVFMRFFPVGVTGSCSQTIIFYDDMGNIVHAVSQLSDTSESWKTYQADVSVSGVRYVSFTVDQNGGTPKIGQICVTYE